MFSSNKSNIDLDSKKFLRLILCLSPNKTLKSIVRVHGISYLIVRELKRRKIIKEDPFNIELTMAGPYSNDLEVALMELINKGEVEVTPKPSEEEIVFEYTFRYANKNCNKIIEETDDKLLKIVNAILSRYANAPLMMLLSDINRLSQKNGRKLILL